MTKPTEPGDTQKVGQATIAGIPAIAGSTSERILEAATALLITEGYEGLSMRKVGSLVGLSQAAIYRHFKDKSALVGAIVEGGYTRLRAGIKGATVTGANATELLASGIRAYAIFALQNSSLFKAVMLQDLGPSHDKVDAFTPGVIRTRETFGRLAGLIQQGIQEGGFGPCDIEITVQAVWAAMFGMAARLAIEADDSHAISQREALIERQIEILLDGLRGCRTKEKI